MHIHIHPLNHDFTFLVSLFATADSPTPFYTFVTDPWLNETITAIHSLFSTLEHGPSTPPFITSLASLPHPINAVILTQANVDHVNLPSLSTLPRSTTIYAVPTAAEIVKGWNIFDTIIPIVQFNPPAPSETNPATTTIQLPNNHGTIDLTHLPAPRFWQVPFLYSFLSIHIHPTSGPSHHTVITAHGAPTTALSPFLALLPKEQRRIDLLVHPLVQVLLPLWLGGNAVPGKKGLEALLKELPEEVEVRRVLAAHDEEKVGKGLVGAVTQYFDGPGEEVEGVPVWRVREGGWKWGVEGEAWEGWVSEEWGCCKPRGVEGKSGEVVSVETVETVV